jgi:hypothetical protein
MSRRNFFAILFVALAICSATNVEAATLVSNPFLNGFQNWVDPAVARGGDWRLNLLSNTVMETSDLAATGNAVATANNGNYIPSLLVQNNYTTPATYDINARMWSSDDDGWGLVFGYQDIDNYYRVLFRAQANGNLGGTTGTSVQKVVGGVVTQISPAGIGAGNTAFPTLPMIATRQPFDVKISVTGTNYSVTVAGVNGGNPLQSGSDAGLAPGKIGIQSWAQLIGPNQENPWWGTEVETISVSDNSGSLYSGNFVNPTKWRNLAMANQAGTLRTNDSSTAIIGDDRGNFGALLNAPWIYQKSNGFEYATGPTGSTGADANPVDHVDFLGPATVINEAGANNWSDYELKVRMGAVDDDGIGVIVRAQDDNNFYRINFSRQSIADSANSRAAQGLSIQKVKNGQWSQVFRDDQTSPLFVYTNSNSTAPTTDNTPATGMPMFDLRVRMIGNTFDIQVIDLFNGNVVKQYPLITDANDPILTGSVGLTTWGTENVFWSMYGGDSSQTPFLVEIPEPATACLLLLAIGGVASVRRRVA